MQYLPCSGVKSESGGWILVTVVMVTVVMVIVGVGVSRGRHTVSAFSHQALVQTRFVSQFKMFTLNILPLTLKITLHLNLTLSLP